MPVIIRFDNNRLSTYYSNYPRIHNSSNRILDDTGLYYCHVKYYDAVMARSTATATIVIKGLIAIVIMVFLMSLVACVKENEDDNIWFDEHPSFVTRELEVAQNEVPFKIILPTYLPENVIIHPQIQGYTK